MNLGLGNRTTLKKFLLPGGLAATSSQLVPDAAVDALGLGVAGWCEQHCGRKFGRVVGDTAQFEGARLTFVLPRYPVEAVTAVEVRSGLGAAWEARPPADVVAGLDETAGLLRFAAPPTADYGVVRVTWTGGYWFDTSEDASGTLPAGAVALPADLQLAWLLCCQEVWNKKDKLGLSLSAAADVHVGIAKLELPTGIRQMLAPYRRFQLT